MKMTFKPFFKEKSGTIYKLLSESYGQFLKDNPECRESWRRNWRDYDDDVSSHPKTVGNCGFFSYADGKLIGFASFDTRGQNGRVIVGHNCVLPAFQGKGFGHLQLRELLRVLQCRGFQKAVVTTGGHQFFAPAIHMYKRCGFRETGRFAKDKASGLRTIELVCDLSITVRPAERKDFGRVLMLFKQLWPGKALNRKRQEVIYQAMQKSDGYELLCAERESRVVGFASVSIQYNFWQEGSIAHITTMIVDKTCRKQGIGSRVIGEIQEIARNRGCGNIELESAFHRLQAHSFYEKMGFDKRAFFFSKNVD